jgi:hypothetical protein
MSYLLDFVKSFDENELKQFRQLDLIGKEELVRDEYLNSSTDKKFDETKLPAKLKLTPSHFDKINSVLLGKIIFRLYGDDYKKILSSILLRGLSGLLLHEIKIVQRKIEKQNNAEVAAGFYKSVFDSLIKMFHPNYNSKLTHEFGKKYLSALGKNKTVEHETYIALFAHYGDMIAEIMAGNELKYKKQAWAVLEKWQKRLAQINNANVDAYYYFVLGNYYKYFTDSADLFLKANQNGLKVIDKTSNETKRLLHGRLLCETGFGYIEKNDFGMAQSFYEKAFRLTDEQFSKPYFHYGNYFYSCLCNRQPTRAKQIFDNNLQPYLQNSTHRSLQFDILQMKFVLSLHLKNYDSAFECLNEMRAYKKNEVTHFGNIIIRFSETLYYYLLKEYEVAAAMAKKNIKFLSLPENDIPQYVYHRQYIDCIDKLIKQKEGKLRFPEKLEIQIAGLQKGIYHMYNSLL